jgi:hypothetical protein
MIAITTSCKTLNELKLKSCPLTRVGIQRLLQHESELSALSLELCFNLTNEDLPLLFGSPQLSKLSIAHNTQFDDRGVASLAVDMGRSCLQEIDITGCSSLHLISKESLEQTGITVSGFVDYSSRGRGNMMNRWQGGGFGFA